MVKKLWPDGAKKAFNITYDDGVLQDVRFVALLNRYNLKGTFNLNSQLMQEEFCWQHESGMTVKRLPKHIAADLYRGHEVAGHTLTHPYMEGLSEGEVMRQMGQDKADLERLLGREVSGFAVPFSYYSPLIAECARRCGFEYARCSEERYCYNPPEDYYRWAAGAFHLNPRVWQFADGFFSTDTELALCQIVGHSYDLDAENMWDNMEQLLRRVAMAADVVSLTNIEIVRYLRAMEKAQITAEYIRNGSNKELWFDADGKAVAVKAGETLFLQCGG